MAVDATAPRTHPLRRLWRRDLLTHPTGRARAGNLALVVAVTISLYYQLYVGGAVATQVLADFHMSFVYYTTVIAASSALGALASLATGVTDRVGRANLVAYGTVVVSLITAFGVPHAGTKLQLAFWLCAAGLVEGTVLVATPALVRDFSPQVGRARAMAFWTMGPVLGSLIVSEVTSHTLGQLPTWQDQYRIAGYVGLVVAVVTLALLRELHASLRNQVQGALAARTQESPARPGPDGPEAARSPYRQMLTPDIVGSSIAISVFLLFYYTAVLFLPIFFETSMGFTDGQANGLLNWLWSATVLSMLVFGVLSDRLRVRKPFMLVGGLATVAIDLAFVAEAGDRSPSYRSIAILLALSGVLSSAAYVPWMASFTETVERRNPALTATGLAVWGWILRLVVAAAIIGLPHLVTSVTPLADDGAQVQAVATQTAKDFPRLYAEIQVHPEVFVQLGAYASPQDIPAPVLSGALATVGPEALAELRNPKAQADLRFLGGKTAADVRTAQQETPGQWRTWLWICAFGAIGFCPLIFLMAGAWRPAKRDDADTDADDVAGRDLAHQPGDVPSALPAQP